VRFYSKKFPAATFKHAYLDKEKNYELTFSLVSIHLLMAMREDPVRSFMSRIALETIARVAIVDI